MTEVQENLSSKSDSQRLDISNRKRREWDRRLKAKLLRELEQASISSGGDL